jgi:predicted Zn-dependent peptidase
VSSTPSPLRPHSVPRAALLIALMVAGSAGCRGGTAAGRGETLPGRTRPLLEHNWPHPRELRFAANRFVPPDATAALITTTTGLRAYVIHDPSERLVQVTAAIPMGRSLEQAGEIGAADVLSRFLSQQIADRLGPPFTGRIQIDQDVDLARVSVAALADDWREVLSAVVDALRRPRLDPLAIAAYRTGPGFARRTRGLGGPAFRPAVELARMTADYPLAPPDAGLTVRPDAVRRIASRSLRPEAVVVGIGGGVSREPAQRELESLTAEWQAPAGAGPGTARAAGPGKPAAARSRTIDEPGYTTWIAVGHPMPKVAAGDEAAVAVMTEIVNVRLNITIREIRGLANQAVLQVPATTAHDGLLHVRTGGRAEAVAPLIRYSLEELGRIRQPGGAPTVDELEQVKGGLVLGRWEGSLDGARNASATYAVETARYGSLDRLRRWPDAVRAVTAKDVTAVAGTYVRPDDLAVVVIGPLDAVRKARHPRWPAALEEVLPGGSPRSTH